MLEMTGISSSGSHSTVVKTAQASPWPPEKRHPQIRTDDARILRLTVHTTFSRTTRLHNETGHLLKINHEYKCLRMHLTKHRYSPSNENTC